MGSEDIPVSFIVYAAIFLALVGLTAGFAIQTKSVVKELGLELQGRRINNTAMALYSMPSGYVQVPLAGYKFNLEGSEISLSYGGRTVSGRLSHNLGYDGYRWPPGEPKRINETLCMRKKIEGDREILVFSLPDSSGDC